MRLYLVVSQLRLSRVVEFVHCRHLLSLAVEKLCLMFSEDHLFSVRAT